MISLSHSLRTLQEQSLHVDQLYRWEVKFGDLIIVSTEDFIYSIVVLEKTHYLVSGGVFERNNLSPMKISISGCRWEQTTVEPELLAARGYQIMFSNGLITLPIKQIYLIRSGWQN